MVQNSSGIRPARRGGVIPVIEMRGVIQDGGGGFTGGGINFKKFSAQVERAATTRGATGIALVLNSPGGSPAQSELLAKRLRVVAERHNLPVYAFVEDAAASGGYWLAAAADEIYCAETSAIGSIGVISQYINYKELAERLGIKAEVITAGENKARMNPLKDLTPEDREWLKRRMAQIHEMFKSWIIQRRGNKLKGPLDKLFTGDFWTGKEALELGLVDGFGDWRTVLEQKFPGATYKMMQSRPSLFQSFAQTAENLSARTNPATFLEQLAQKISTPNYQFGFG